MKNVDDDQRKTADETLCITRNALNIGILNSLTSHIAVLNTQGTIIAVNNAWRLFTKENIFPESNQDMLGVNYLDACKNTFNQPYGDKANAAHDGIAAVLSDKQKTFNLEYPFHQPNQECWFRMNVSSLHAPYTGVVISHENISDLKHREQQDKKHLDELAHVTRLGLMGEMASGIAHEVNQPLAAISSYTQVSLNLINTENPDLVKLTEILYKTQQQALRAGRIIHRMREFVKSHAQQRSTADINTLIHNCIDLCIAEFKQNNIKLTCKLEDNLPPLQVDEIQIEQVIINLIRNSINALQNLPATKQPHLTIQSHLAPNNAIHVRVKDNGAGLNEEQRQKIFVPFYTTKTDGVGMGLSISCSLIEAHEGTLHFNSKLGKGTTFYFTLPCNGSHLKTVGLAM